MEQYFDKKQENVNVDVFELEENVSEIKIMKISDFKALAEKAGLLKKASEDQSEIISMNPEEAIACSFEVVED